MSHLETSPHTGTARHPDRFRQHGRGPAPVTLPLARRAVVDSWRSTAAWAAALVAIMALYLPLYPAIGGNGQMRNLLATLPPGLIKALNYDQIATGPGYTQATFFGLMGFLLTSIAAVAWGAAAIGGDEEAGLLELTLAHGVTRVQVVLERALALVVRIAILCAVVFAVLVLLNGPAELGLSVGRAAAGVLMFAELALLSGLAALLAGTISGRRIWGVGIGAAVAVEGYVLNAVGNQNPDLSWLHRFSPYYWAYGHAPLVHGVDAGAAVGFGILLVALVAASALVLHRRDVGV